MEESIPARVLHRARGVGSVEAAARMLHILACAAEAEAHAKADAAEENIEAASACLKPEGGSGDVDSEGADGEDSDGDACAQERGEDDRPAHALCDR